MSPVGYEYGPVAEALADDLYDEGPEAEVFAEPLVIAFDPLPPPSPSPDLPILSTAGDRLLARLEPLLEP